MNNNIKTLMFIINEMELPEAKNTAAMNHLYDINK